jgi:hypothetical protein
MLFLGFLLRGAIAASGQTADPPDFWNAKYKDPKFDFNHRPSRLLVEAIAGRRRSGDAIDLGMGEGRNAIYLARAGLARDRRGPIGGRRSAGIEVRRGSG